MGVQQTFGGTARVLFPIMAGLAFDRFPEASVPRLGRARGWHDSAWVGYGGVHPPEARTRGRSGGLIVIESAHGRNSLEGELHARSVDLAQFRCSLSASWRWRRACGSEPTGTGSSSPSAHDHRLAATGRSVSSARRSALPLVVKVTSSAGTALAGVAVPFAVTAGAATVTPATATTDATGQAKAQVTLGSSPGTSRSRRAVVGTSSHATFVVTAGTSTQTLRARPARRQTPAAGSVLPGVSGTGICLGGGAGGAEYALVAFYRNPTPRHSLGQVSVTAHGATAVATPASRRSRRLRDAAARTRALGGGNPTCRRRSTRGCARSRARARAHGSGARARRATAARASTSIPANRDGRVARHAERERRSAVHQPDQRRRARRRGLATRRSSSPTRPIRPADSPTPSICRSRRCSTR